MFGLERLPAVAPHHADKASEYAALLTDPPTGLLVQPLGVISDDQNKLFLGELTHKCQKGHPNKKPVGRVNAVAERATQGGEGQP
ncbi:hypothetical protein [Streptomyces umbrinus]|uniref:hypothetical protein n=1 Tax=Streptomyces umbrinus TaxID=67370 RepID=UPI00340E6D87